MNCQTFLDMLQSELDGGPPADAEEHRRDCARCRELARAARMFQDGLRRILAPVVPPDLATAIVGRVQADRRSRRRRRPIGVFAMAAAVLIVIGVYVFWQTSPNESPPIARNPEVVAPAETAVALQDSMNEVGSAIVSLTARTADETVGQSRILVPVVTGPVLDDLDLQATFEGSTTPLRGAGQGLTAGLEPVTSSARRAVSMLLRDLPPIDADVKPGM